MSSEPVRRNPSVMPLSPFPYLELGSITGTPFDAAAFGSLPQPDSPAKFSEQEIADRCAQADRCGYERGSEEAANAAKNEMEDASGKQRARVDEALRQFEIEKQRYFQQVEAEVIQLSLAIARKVLGQEAAVDSLLLAGTVRAALDRLNSTSQITLTVHPAALGKWRKALAERREHLEFAEDDSLPPEGCVLRSQLGTTEISLQQQLKEVEHSFFDLLAQRPEAGVRVQ
jgi:flagellar assembly protein FliH